MAGFIVVDIYPRIGADPTCDVGVVAGCGILSARPFPGVWPGNGLIPWAWVQSRIAASVAHRRPDWLTLRDVRPAPFPGVNIPR